MSKFEQVILYTTALYTIISSFYLAYVLQVWIKRWKEWMEK